MMFITPNMSVVRQTALLSAVAVLLSFVITGGMHLLVLGMTSFFWTVMTFAILVPWGIGIPIGWYMASQQKELLKSTAKLQDMQDRLEEVNRQLNHKANFDGLTGLANREHFIEKFDDMRKASDHNILMIVDADHFKNINDSFGHLVGDKALVLLGNVFRRILRKGDLVGRIGGEEFGILLPDTVRAEGEIIGEMIRHEIENTVFEPQEGVPHRMTVSIGLASASSTEERALPMRNADTALFEAKRRGRNQCVLYLSGMRSKPRPLYEAVSKAPVATHWPRAIA